MKRIYLAGMILAVVITIFITSVFITSNKNGNKATELIPVRIGYREHDFYAPLFIGLEKEIFKKHGLDVKPIKFESTNQITDALIAGRLDAALGGVNTFLLFTIEEKTPGYFKIFSLATEDNDHPCTALVAPYDSKLKMEDLNNKKFGSYLGSAIKIMYEQLIEANNLNGTNLLQMEPKMELPALQAGQIDVAFLLEPQITIANHKKIARPLESAIFDKYFVSNIPLTASVVSQKFISDNPTAVNRLVKATDEAIDVINSEPDALKAILPKYTAADPEIVSQIPVAPFQKCSLMNKEKLIELLNRLKEFGEIKKNIEVENMLFPCEYAETD